MPSRFIGAVLNVFSVFIVIIVLELTDEAWNELWDDFPHELDDPSSETSFTDCKRILKPAGLYKKLDDGCFIMSSGFSSGFYSVFYSVFYTVFYSVLYSVF